jgi:hypothetical protein
VRCRVYSPGRPLGPGFGCVHPIFTRAGPSVKRDRLRIGESCHLKNFFAKPSYFYVSPRGKSMFLCHFVYPAQILSICGAYQADRQSTTQSSRRSSGSPKSARRMRTFGGFAYARILLEADEAGWWPAPVGLAGRRGTSKIRRLERLLARISAQIRRRHDELEHLRTSATRSSDRRSPTAAHIN